MFPQHRTAIFLLPLLLAFIFLVRAQDPTHTVNYFRNLPARLFFFDDTESAIYHDSIEGNIYVSSDEGKSWSRAADIPEGEANIIIQHPFNNRYAFVLTAGTTHYRTEDRGKTWRPFDMPIAPSLVAKPLSFHSDKAKYGYILYQGATCDTTGWSVSCHDETYYTKEAFSDTPQLLMIDTTRCQFAASSTDFKHLGHPDLILCVGFDTSSMGQHTLASSRLFSSTDFFTDDIKIEDLGIGKGAKGVLAFAIVSKFAVVAIRDLSSSNAGEMLYVSLDGNVWAKAQFPHASSANLRENAYTIVESTTHSLAVDVLLQDHSAIGTLFVSNSNGTFFVQSLKDTNRNIMGFVDYENLYGVEGVGLANVVANAGDVEGRGADKQLRTLITFDDGSSWTPVRPPTTDIEGRPISCSDPQKCSLHFHSVTTPHNFGRIFSSPAPGFVMGVGSIGATLQRYDESGTFLSTNAGVDWKMIAPDAHKYEFGDQGSILVVVNDEEPVSDLRYSTDLGKSWKSYDFGVKVRAGVLTTIPDSTSQKFLLVGALSRKDATDSGRYVVVFLDFAPTRARKCGENDFERWYARTAKGKQCLMGHKQWYKRRKPDADCYVGDKFDDPVGHEDNCECDDEDFECDYNFVRNGDECVPVGPEPIPAGVCTGDPDQLYKGSSGWRKIPGNTCVGGLQKDEKIDKKCSQAQPADGEVIHQTFEFPSQILQHAYFRDSFTILVRLRDHSMWQSSNEGYTWNELMPGQRFLAFYHHAYTKSHAYLITNTNTVWYTTDTGRKWAQFSAPTLPNTFGEQVLQFHPQTDLLIWTGNKDCDGEGETCRAQAYFSRDNGQNWKLIEDYVQKCAWAKDAELKVDPSQILCESYLHKSGSQRQFNHTNNELQLIGGTNFFEQRSKVFDRVVGFTKFSEYLIVAEYLPQIDSLDLQVSLDGKIFATGRFPPDMRPQKQHAYTILESSTDAIFMLMTMSEHPRPFWGNILKSNSNGTYFGLSIANVNRDLRGLVDFEKMIGLDGIALINIVTNTEEAIITGEKKLQTRITHNDGSTWKPLSPPPLDAFGQKYPCDRANCALHIHGYTERPDPRATYTSPSAVGLVMAVGNVGEHLQPYIECDTFLSLDAGFTWTEVHKDAHLWEFGDSGALLIMANDEEPTDHVLFTTDQGLTWREYKFGNDKLRVRSIVTVPSDTSRRFILFGSYPRSPNSVAVHIDFSAFTSKQCVFNPDDSAHDDFEFWSPSEEREERCLFGRQTLYHRRVRNANCFVGDLQTLESEVKKNCSCAHVDFECEFNYVKNANDECVLVAGTTPLPNDDSCRDDEEYWYERTAYRKIPFSSCEEGDRRDRGERHRCPGIRGHGTLFWGTIALVPFAFTALVAYWYYRRSGLARGTIRLPGGDSVRLYRGESGVLDYMASVPWFLVGIAGIAWGSVLSVFESIGMEFRSRRRGYRDLPVDEDAQILRFEDEDG